MRSEKKIVYLIQGRSDLIVNYFQVFNRSYVDAFFLTYDERIEGAYFYPNSTWSQGRNKLLELAKSAGDYLYYVFCDDDIKFKSGGWELFERQLLRYQPAVAVPVFGKTRKSPIKFFRFQNFYLNDEQFMAFHKDVVKDQVLLPYQSRFDSIHWWASCEIQEILIQNFYFNSSLQFNNVVISNEQGGRYEDNEENRVRYQISVKEWLNKQFVSKYKKTHVLNKKRRLYVFFSTFCYFVGFKLRRKVNYSLKINYVNHILRKDSDVLAGFRNGLNL